MAMRGKHGIEILDKILTDGVSLAPEDKLMTYQGVLYPATVCKLENFQALETFDARMDDVILVGYPKTGTNWVETILSGLEIRAGKYTEEEKKKRMAIEEELAVPSRLEFGNLDAFKRMRKLPSRRIIVTHLPPHLLPKSIFKSKAKILVLLRNPKDTMVSYFHFDNNLSVLLNSTWDAYFTKFMNGEVCWGSYFDHVSEWDEYIDDENIMGICYEELKEDPNLGLQKIAKFFGFSVNDEDIKSVVENCSFKAMKQKSTETHGAFGDALFRKGSVGDWKNLFSESQNQEMDKRFKECLAKTKLGAKMKIAHISFNQVPIPSDTKMHMNRKRIEILDKLLADGDKLAPEDKLFTFQGVLYPAAVCKPENFQALETFDARIDDVILAAYPKTGTNWLQTMVRGLEIRSGKYTEEEKKRKVAIEEELAVPPCLEFGDLDAFKRLKKLPSRRIIVTHLPPHLLPKSIFQSKAKVLALTRNPKDTMVSYFHFYNNLSAFPNVTWDAYFTDFMNGKVCWGSYFDHVSEWDKYIEDENIMGICYEELKENLHSELQKIATFFGFSVNDEDIKSVVENCSFKAMKQKSTETHGAFGDILFRKGSVGDWKNLFSESQNQEMDKRFKECLAKTKLGAKMKYDVYCKI